ncbi:MAG: hypothetical protein HRT38_16220 [Alteromonadaceae bacterium]|nr:hypothetical protein [Alteromonadaceae bacterium]
MGKTILVSEGYVPVQKQKGYIPKTTTSVPIGDSVTGGYTPTTSEGNNPTNTPPPPGDE